MSFTSSVKQRLRRDYFRWRHHQTIRGILKTTPVAPGDMPFILLSMVQKRDVLSYLVALKSFTGFVNPQRVVIVCDPSIDERDRQILRSHVPHVELRAADEFTHPDTPRGGCWERLLAISSYVADAYVVQLDADTVTIAPPAEVIQAISNKVGFVLGEEANQSLLSLAQTSANAKADKYGQLHIQGYSEACMAEVGLPASSRYVRGCAGFTGFPPSATMPGQLLEFSRSMSKKIGFSRWSSWGTEQVTSNYLVANALGTTVLPYPKYGTPNAMDRETAFLHFIGTMRFVNNKYEQTSREVIQRMAAAPYKPGLSS
jgi:hypothetical protein